MRVITRNPYRVLGMYANDSTKVMTANIAKIRAYMKVGKHITFKSDFKEIFGPIDRSEQEIESAIRKLANPKEALVWKLFWIHHTAFTNENHIDTTTPSTAGSINTSILKLYKSDAKTAVAYIGFIFESQDTQYNLWENEPFWSTDEEREQTAEKYTKRLLSEFGEYGNSLQDFNYSGWFWWVWTSLDSSNIFRQNMEKEYRNLALTYIKEIISGKISVAPSFGKENKLLWLASPSIKILDAIMEKGSYDVTVSAEIQLVYDQFAQCLLDFCLKIYDVENTVVAEPIVELAKFVSSKISIYAYKQDTKERVMELYEHLMRESDHLAPKESALIIQDNIRKFCAKDDTARWALTLVRTCAIHLREIKSILGPEHPCLEYLCTRVADNAIYSADIELGTAKRIYNNEINDRSLAQENLKAVVTRCCQLAANIKELKLSESFRTTKFNSFSDRCYTLMTKLCLDTESIKADISFKDDNDKLSECGNDYQKLVEFVLDNPNSPQFQEAIKQIWEIEDREFPSPATAKTLLEYKQKFCNSHNDQKILNLLDQLLLGRSNGTLMEYKQVLRLWPDHPKMAIIEGRIDLLNFKNCVCSGDWEDYLKAFPNGQHRAEAQRKIEEEKFGQCKTIADYIHFIHCYPASDLHDAACSKVEELIYQKSLLTCDYVQYIRRYPNGKHIQEIKDKLEYQVCKTAISSNNYSDYYSKYPKGKYTSEVKTAEEEAYFEKCKSYKDFKTYLSIYPDAMHKDIATKIIKRRNNKMLCRVILVLAIVCAIGRMIWADTDNEPGNSTFTDSTSEITHNTPLSKPATAENTSYSYDYGTVEPAQTDDYPDSEYRDNSLSTGSRPYRSYFGRSLTGGHKMSFKTDTGSDYVVIIKQHGNNRSVDHIYIKGGDNASMKIPDGTYDVYFYSGNGWNPYKQNGEREGGFVENAAIQKDGPVTLQRRYEGDYYYDQTLSYTLYPVYNGNLALQKASEEEAF